LRRLRWLKIALSDRQSQLDYIARDNRAAAVKIGDRLAAQIQQIAVFPEIGKPGRVAGTRESIVTGTRLIIVYRLTNSGTDSETDSKTESTVDILRILHGSQMWPPDAKDNKN